MGGMKAKRRWPLECPVCTSREVVTRGLPNSGIRIMDKYVTGAERQRTPKLPKPKPKIIRYRCKQCGHKFTLERNSRA